MLKKISNKLQNIFGHFVFRLAAARLLASLYIPFLIYTYRYMYIPARKTTFGMLKFVYPTGSDYSHENKSKERETLTNSAYNWNNPG